MPLRFIALTSFVFCLFFLSVSAEIVRKLPEPPPEAKDSKNNVVDKASADFPNVTYRIHKNGRLWNTVNNNGIVGNVYEAPDPEIGRVAPDFYFPKYSRKRHGFFSALWVGGVLNNDTSVTVALDVTYEGWWSRNSSEFWPDYYPGGNFEIIYPEGGSENSLAKGQQSYRATFTDTFKYESFVPFSTYDGRYHRPLNIKVIQTSYSWSYSYAEDLLIVDYQVQNIGDQPIKDAFFGLFHRGGVHYTNEQPFVLLDDLEGYIDSVPYEFEDFGKESMNISWVCDKDGKPIGDAWWFLSTRNCLGIAPLNLTDEIYIRNFNWWVYDYSRTAWGPRQRGTLANPLRLFHGQFGMPLSDGDKYYMMAFPEVDYSGFNTAVPSNQTQGWMPPPEEAEQIARGHFSHYVTSFGPYYIEPGDSKRLTVAYAIGENVHAIPNAYWDIFDPNNPDPFLETLDFTDLVNNMRWAKRIYDNPGVDTDFDGDSGKYFFYVDPGTGDSIQVFYQGDGIPDFRGATPPPPPPIRVDTEEGKVTVRWNGREVEGYFDTFSLIKDFEGYRVYLARSKDENDIVLLASYDRENFSRYRWNGKRREYELREVPFSLDSLRSLYGDDFEPLDYTRVSPLVEGEDLYFFIKVDYNFAALDDPNGIHKLYPDATLDTTDVDEDGRMRYYEYEYVIENLLPTVPYYVSVTAFDFGYPAKALESLESSPYDNFFEVFAVAQGNEKVVKGDGELNVYCYPNPYRVDAHYSAQGFENRFDDLAPDRARNIYFANLPNRCTISIYSLDGDLIKKIEHDEPEGSGTAAIERFDLISRNTQAVVSGLYYWVVESEYGNQIGKLVIIR